MDVRELTNYLEVRQQAAADHPGCLSASDVRVDEVIGTDTDGCDREVVVTYSARGDRATYGSSPSRAILFFDEGDK